MATIAVETHIFKDRLLSLRFGVRSSIIHTNRWLYTSFQGRSGTKSFLTSSAAPHRNKRGTLYITCGSRCVLVINVISRPFSIMQSRRSFRRPWRIRYRERGITREHDWHHCPTTGVPCTWYQIVLADVMHRLSNSSIRYSQQTDEPPCKRPKGTPYESKPSKEMAEMAEPPWC